MQNEKTVGVIGLGLMGEVLTRVYYESQGKRPYTVRERRNLDRPTETRLGRAA